MESIARRSLRYSADYLQAARLVLAEDRTDPAISLSVHSAIYAKDALQLKLNQPVSKTRSHSQAISDSRSLGVLPESTLIQLGRQLAAKSEAEYGQDTARSAIAESRVVDAERFFATIAKKIDEL